MSMIVVAMGSLFRRSVSSRIDRSGRLEGFLPWMRVVVVVFAVFAGVPASAAATASARMGVAFVPERLGAPTSVFFGFQIMQGGLAPAALAGVELSYPRGLGLATSGLGVAACSPVRLEAIGPSGCPADSRMGYGAALVQIAFGGELVKERVSLALLAGPSPDGYLHVLVYAAGEFPVQAAVVITAVVLPGRLVIAIPPIPSLPGAPYVAVTEMQLTLGGRLTYYEAVKGRRVAYHPAGVGLPGACPHGGFRFAATFDFLDGEHASSQSAVACPKRRG